MGILADAFDVARAQLKRPAIGRLQDIWFVKSLF